MTCMHDACGVNNTYARCMRCHWHQMHGCMRCRWHRMHGACGVIDTACTIKFSNNFKKWKSYAKRQYYAKKQLKCCACGVIDTECMSPDVSAPRSMGVFVWSCSNKDFVSNPICHLRVKNFIFISTKHNLEKVWSPPLVQLRFETQFAVNSCRQQFLNFNSLI
jgi:hypothetical protein